MRRSILIALLAAAAYASPAAAQSRCAAPDRADAWRSCLTASHRLADDGAAVHLTKARPRLVIRYADGCPKGADRRTVVLRTGDGDRLGRATARSRCRRDVARWHATLRLELDLPAGTVVRSLWSGIADGARAPKVRL
jgi:hypothetical protein